MPAYTRKPDSALVIRFTRDGEPDEVQTAPTPHRALGAALVILAHHDGLYAGDRLAVTTAADDPATDLPEVSPSAQHGS